MFHLYQASVFHRLFNTYCGARVICVNWHLLVGVMEKCATLGSFTSRFSWHGPGFLGFKEFSPGIPQNLV
jgi:hypothetical protein